MTNPDSLPTRGIAIARLTTFSALIIGLIALLSFLASHPLTHFQPFASPVVNHLINYQLSGLLVAALAIAATWLFAGRVRLRYLRPKISGTLQPLTRRGAAGEWRTDGWVYCTIMVAIIGVATFVQVSPRGFDFQAAYLLLVVPLAAMNAFTEEAVFRLPFVTMGANDTRSHTFGLVMSAVVFGVVHYWGIAPNGLFGAIMSALLGFFLAKSMQETQGFLWAFMIHFFLDVAVLTFILNQVT